MNGSSVEIHLLLEGRASGLLRSPKGKIPWTAIRDARGDWYVVIDSAEGIDDVALLRLLASTVRRTLKIRAA